MEDNISEVTENDDILDDLPETEVDQALSYFITQTKRKLSGMKHFKTFFCYF